jgi:hypothetical protein
MRNISKYATIIIAVGLLFSSFAGAADAAGHGGGHGGGGGHSGSRFGGGGHFGGGHFGGYGADMAATVMDSVLV